MRISSTPGPRRRKNWNVAAGQELSLFCSGTIEHADDVASRDLTEIKERIALSGRAISGDGLTGRLCLLQESQKARLHLANAIRIALIALEPVKCGRFLLRAQSLQ